MKLADIGAALTAANSPYAFTTAIVAGKVVATFTQQVTDTTGLAEGIAGALVTGLAYQEATNRTILSNALPAGKKLQKDGVDTLIATEAAFNSNIFGVTYPSDDATTPRVTMVAALNVPGGAYGNFSTFAETVPLLQLVPV